MPINNKWQKKQKPKEDKDFENGEAKLTDIIEDCLETGQEVLGIKDKSNKKNMKIRKSRNYQREDTDSKQKCKGAIHKKLELK